MTGRCGLIDPNGPCRCARKTQGFIRQGIVDPAHLRFTKVHLDKTKEEAAARARDLQGQVEQAYAELLRSQPVAQSSDFASVPREVLHRPEVSRTLGVEN